MKGSVHKATHPTMAMAIIYVVVIGMNVYFASKNLHWTIAATLFCIFQFNAMLHLCKKP